MTNEFGVKLDKNGYAPSVMSSGSSCLFCRSPVVARHEVFHGFNRQKSKAFGFWINVCPEHHSKIHNNAKIDNNLKRQAEQIALAQYGWTIEDFIERFGKNYL